MAENYPVLIPGAADTGSLTVTSPYDLKAIGSAGIANTKAVEQALATADNLYRNRKAWLTALVLAIPALQTGSRLLAADF